ncbi:MAG: zinc-binding alcohol dehydrogenase [Rhizobiales bacterium]|nr:zinc-binding alcohol dehydrogenase [Hyphomicrobiales bacterium]
MATSRKDAVAQALWYTAPGRAEIREQVLPPLAAGAVRVRARYGAISRGTEALVSAGRVPPSEYERMRAPFMQGAFPCPVKYGYATVGHVEAGPTELIGRAVFALYPHQSLFDVPASMVVTLPADVPTTRAVLAANMETALNAVWDADPVPSGRIAVVGAGVVGALVAYRCARLPGTEVTLVDINPARKELAGKLGVGFASPDAAPKDCALVVHASATAAGLATALSLAAFEATILELSWYGDAEVSVPLGGAFHSRRLRLVSSQVGHVAPSRRAEWTHHRRLTEAVRLLADARLDALLAPAVDFRDLPARLNGILNARSGVLCQLIQYP